MRQLIPEVIYFDPKSLDYSSGLKIKKFAEEHNIPYSISKHVDINSTSIQEKYAHSKKTIYVTVNRQKKLAPCKPSADYQFHISKSCPGHCEYCYLQTTQGEKPFIYLYVNIDEILSVVNSYIFDKSPSITYFESGSLTDPVAYDYLTNNLSKCIEFFGSSNFGRLRVITKYNIIDNFLSLYHNGHTKFRFSINTDYVIRSFEHNTSSYEERLEAIQKMASAGYPIGFIIAPIIIYENWSKDYESLLFDLSNKLDKYSSSHVTFELIQHRFTKVAKSLILERFPNTKLDLNEDNRQLKWGPYGKFKYVYKKDESQYIKDSFTQWIQKYFPGSEIEYFT